MEAYQDASAVKGADIVVVTAGKPRKPGMTRMNLLNANSEIIRDIALKIYPANKDAVYLIITNPVDHMATLFKKYTGGNVIGSGCHLDTLRFKVVLAKMLGVKPAKVEAYVGGGHGRYIVPLWSTVKIQGKPLHEWLKQEEKTINKEEARKKTIQMADQIIQKAGGTMLGPAAAFTEIIETIAKDQGKILSIATPHQIDGKLIYLSRPVKVSKEKVEPIETLSQKEVEEITRTGKKLLEILNS